MNALGEVAFGIAGVGGVAAFVLWSVYKQWLKLPIFQKMTRDQQYKLFRLFIILVFVFGIFGVAVYGYVSIARGQNKEQSTNGSEPQFKDKPKEVKIRKVDPPKDKDDAPRVPPDD
jgi:hypothetical protein